MEARAAIRHGGDLGEARRLFPDAPLPWIDLSTGINPVPYPCPPFDASLLARLPAPAEVAALEAAAARTYGADPAEAVAAPGTQALIAWLPVLRPQGRVAVIGPTYAEHAAAWAQAGHAVATVANLDEAARADVAVVVNPNNPDGRVTPRPALLEAAGRLAERGGLLVVDEAFADLEPVASLCEAVPEAAMVLRSFGKTYGLAGLRLGFAVADPGTAARIAEALGPWAVSGPALAVGQAALSDAGWRAEAAGARAADAARLDRMIARAGGRIVGGTCLFRTADFSDGPGLYRRLAGAGIAVRRFAERPERLRFGLPAGKAAWCRLSRVLR